MKTNLLLAFLILTTCHYTLFAQQDDRLKRIESALPAIDQLFANFAKQNHNPGLVYALIVDGKVHHKGSSGYINTTEKIVADHSSAFRIASMTKSFTAMAIVKLRDEGKLKLDDPVSKYIPELKGQKYLTKDAAPITVRHLLTHGAGFPEDNPWGDRQLATTDKEMLIMIKKGLSYSNVSGVTYEYSNLGFAMLGYMIKKVSGLSYDVYITKNILQPLGMMHTYFEYTKVPADKLAHGYRWLNGQWVEQPLLHDGIYGAMGGMITSMEDFIKYLNLHALAWPARDDADNGPLKRSSIREMQFPWNFSSLNPNGPIINGRNCPNVSAYGYGLRWSKDCEGRVNVGHSGGLPGFGSNWRIMPDLGIGIISFSNHTYASMGSLNQKVLDTLMAITQLKPAPIPVSAILNQRKNELVKLLPEWKNAEATHIFADNFFMDYFPVSLRTEAESIFNRAGKIIRVHELIAENNLRGTFKIECENSDIEISFTLTPQNPPLIQEYNIRERKKS
jgi:CubicO group peptidase (beta-lactamase class C family)